MIHAAILMGTLASASAAQPAEAATAQGSPRHIPAAGGEVILGDKYDGLAYDRESFAPVRRAGDLLFISGIIVTRRAGEGTDVESFKNEVRRTFKRYSTSLSPPVLALTMWS
jgi:enamine deaminase RidA (YjgF/YER057c/UK114 family)